jgi:hypothetical protein
MRYTLLSVVFSRRSYLLVLLFVFCLAMLALHGGSTAQTSAPSSVDSPQAAMCFVDPETGRCLGVQSPASTSSALPTPPPICGPTVNCDWNPTPSPTPVCNRTNVAMASTGAIATGSTTYEALNYPANSAINGDRRGQGWGAGTGGWNDGTRDIYPDWLQIKFNGMKLINEIRVYTLQNDFANPQEPTAEMTAEFYGLQDFEVQAWVGGQWMTVQGGSVAGNDRVMRVFTFPEIATSKIRVYIVNARSHFSRITEVEAFGCSNLSPIYPFEVCLNLDLIDSCTPDPFNPGQCVNTRPPCIKPDELGMEADPVPLIISEYRLRGPGGPNDEFIELFNTADSPITVNVADGSDGWALAASDGNVRFIIPVGTVIPARGHYLAVNSVGYSLGGYPGGNGTTASGDTVYILDIPDRAGIALFNTANPPNFTIANRLDAVGYSTAPALYREGYGFAIGAAETLFNIDYSFYRNLAAGSPQDTNDNVADFIGVEPNATNTGAGQHLGAPGPENLYSPILTGSNKIQVTLLDPAVGQDQPPNRVRNTTPDPMNNSSLGTLSVRSALKNVSGANITRLRFRIIDITTYPYQAGTSDIRAISSTGTVATRSDGSNVFVHGTTLETPPAQFIGGGWNSTWSANGITPSSPLAPGQSISFQFLLGVQQSGNFRLVVVVEALP